MSKQDYIEAENSLFPETGEDENINYYEIDAQDYVYPSQRINFIEKDEEESDIEDLEDDEELAMENLSPVRIIVQKKLQPYNPPKNIIKEFSETDDIYNFRVKVNQVLRKAVSKDKDLNFISGQEIDMYSRIITNRLWYGMHYTYDVEKITNLLLELEY